MKIGIIGLGMVGEAVAYGLRRVGHEVVGFDKDPNKYACSYKDVLDTELIFVCVPTPTIEGRCETRIVRNVVAELNLHQYKGLVVIKSTVPPGTTDSLHSMFPDLRLAFCPEFLRERARFSDFVDNHELCVIGSIQYPDDTILIKMAHGNLPKHFVSMKPIEAELIKYFVNCFNAQRVVFANAFYEVCQLLGVDYTTIKDAATKRSGISPDYLTCNEQTREFGGACLPKDTEAFATFTANLGMITRVFDQIVSENNRIKIRNITDSKIHVKYYR